MSRLLPYFEHKSFLVQVVALLVTILVGFVVVNVLGILVAIPFFGLDVLLNMELLYDYTNPQNLAFLKYFQVVSQLGVFVVPSVLFAYLYNGQPGSFLGLTAKISAYSLFVSILVILVSIPFINFLVHWNEQMKLPEMLSGIEHWMRNMEQQAAEMTEAFLRVNTIGGLLINLLIIALIAAVGEEFLFRGVILRLLLNSSKNVHLAVVVSAVIFSAFHGQFYGFVPRAALGVVFGYIFVWTGSLWIPVVLHMLFNAVSVVVAYLYETGQVTTNYEEFGESSSDWIVVGSFIFTLLLMGILWHRRTVYRHQDLS